MNVSDRQVVELADQVQCLVATGTVGVPSLREHPAQVEADTRIAAHLLGREIGELLAGDPVGAGVDRSLGVRVVERDPAAPGGGVPGKEEATGEQQRTVVDSAGWDPGRPG